MRKRSSDKLEKGQKSKVTERDGDDASAFLNDPRANDERPTHREDFNALLRAAVRKRAPED